MREGPGVECATMMILASARRYVMSWPWGSEKSCIRDPLRTRDDVARQGRVLTSRVGTLKYTAACDLRRLMTRMRESVGDGGACESGECWCCACTVTVCLWPGFNAAPWDARLPLHLPLPSPFALAPPRCLDHLGGGGGAHGRAKERESERGAGTCFLFKRPNASNRAIQTQLWSSTRIQTPTHTHTEQGPPPGAGRTGSALSSSTAERDVKELGPFLRARLLPPLELPYRKWSKAHDTTHGLRQECNGGGRMSNDCIVLRSAKWDGQTQTHVSR